MRPPPTAGPAIAAMARLGQLEQAAGEQQVVGSDPPLREAEQDAAVAARGENVVEAAEDHDLDVRRVRPMAVKVSTRAATKLRLKAFLPALSCMRNTAQPSASTRSSRMSLGTAC
jgi:hypothetical protein